MKKNFIGVDISQKTLDCSVYDKDVKRMKAVLYHQFSNDADGYANILSWLKGLRISRSSIHICMEHTGIYGYDLALYLEKKKVTYSMVPALNIKRAFGMTRGKDDMIDAVRIATYANRFSDELRPTKMKNSVLLKLRDLMNDRKLLVRQAAEHKTVMAANKNHPESIRYRRSEELVSLMEEQIAEIEGEVIAVLKEDTSVQENYMLVKSINGIGIVNAVNTIIFTNNFSSFENARQYASYIGVAPFHVKSGTSVNKGTHVSKMGNKTLKADLSQAAKSAKVTDPEIRQYFERKIKEGKSFGCVLNAIKFKLIERMFAVVRRKTPYVSLMGHIA
jgi:transposase